LVNQHSIGLQYLQMELAINDSEDKPHYKTWERYYSGIINKEEVDKRGYFWAIKEAKIYENSAVLFGSNEMTPTIQTQDAQSLQSEESGKSTSTAKPKYSEVASRLNKIFNQ